MPDRERRPRASVSGKTRGVFGWNFESRDNKVPTAKIQVSDGQGYRRLRPHGSTAVFAKKIVFSCSTERWQPEDYFISDVALRACSTGSAPVYILT
jgi:hypothetical protein